VKQQSARPAGPSARTVWAAAAVAGAAFAALNLALFWTPLYRWVLAPDSSAGVFEAAVGGLAAFPADPARDVLVLGDSRIYSGLDPAEAARRAGGLRFIDGAVPGTTPRCWPFLVRAVDPRGDRFRVVVVPVDTYADDDSAVGSLDGDNRYFDLRYLVFETTPADVWPIVRTFDDWRSRLDDGVALAVRGPLLRDDVQAFLTDPPARFTALRAAAASDRTAALTSAHPRGESLAGLRVDFGRNHIDYPANVDAAERAAIADQVLRRPRPSPSYARYRERWLGALVARYRASGTTIVFVRIPTRPAHRDLPRGPPSGSLASLARSPNVIVLPQAAYVALETPALFADHDHLNAEGMHRFSALLGRDVAATLRGNRNASNVLWPAPPEPVPPETGRPSGVRAQLAAIASAGIPLKFQSYEFFIFFALVAALFYALPRRAGRLVLLAASWYFYARWNAWYVVFIAGLTASDYAIARWIARAPGSRRRTLLWLGVAANLAFLGVFKYANLSTGSLAALLGLQHDPWLVDWIVPIGISFHTFQSISYLVDVYRGRILAMKDPLDYALYIAFFPQLLAGPIVRAERFFGELYGWRRPNADEVLRGAGEIALGLVKKVAVADQLATIADAYFRAPQLHPGAPAAWSGALAFAFQIYFDFSGYSDIAIGCARLLGFDFPANFRRPYLATSIGEFWRRWHISLSSWLRDYLYVSLGGNRGGRLRTYRNLMTTMLLGGLWHGAAWTFVGWGGYHGALLSGERAAGIGRPGSRASRGAVAALRVVATFALVVLGWMLFRARSFDDALAVLRGALAGGGGPWLLTPWMLVPVTVAGIVAVAQERGWTPAPLRASPLVYGSAVAALLVTLELLAAGGPAPPFIYFKF
jgi:D-alanyl-lipoteichoic acid acyltransferase DltB (MBOAT superfamily)